MIDITEEIIANINTVDTGIHEITFDIEEKGVKYEATISVFIDDDRSYFSSLDNPPELKSGSLDVFIQSIEVLDMQGENVEFKYDDTEIWKYFRNE